MSYSWLTFVQARQALAQRLADTGNRFWGDAENGLYIVEALRTWNSLTFLQKAEVALNVPRGTSAVWVNLGNLIGSPRIRTVRDTDVYSAMQYHLLEPATGGTWTGTTQFTLEGFRYGLQTYRDEIVQATACNGGIINLPAPLAQRRITLSDTILEVMRARWVPSAPDQNTFPLPAVTLFRDDSVADQGYATGYLQQSPGIPSMYNVASGPPLSLDVDVPPASVGKYELVANQSGSVFVPPASTLLGIPDDFSWVAKWGALASNLGRESESTDRARQNYCMKRYQDGITLMRNCPWIVSALVNDSPADVSAMSELDGYQSEWDSTAGSGTIATAGMDLIGILPNSQIDTSVTLTLLGNAIVPVVDGDFIQISRDTWTAVLDYAQFLATFKQGGYEFEAALELERRFIAAAMNENSRLEALGLFADVYLQRGNSQEREQTRYVGKDDV